MARWPVVRDVLQPDRRGVLAAAAILAAASAVLGGASRDNVWPLAIVEFAALPLAWMGLRAGRPGAAAAHASPWPPVLAGLIVALPLAQLVPLPPDLWTPLPGAAFRIEALRLAGLPLGWAPISLFPRATLGCALALTPPLAMFLGARRLASEDLNRLAALWIGIGLTGLVLGAAQLASPGSSPVYLYATTNVGSLVGFFANRNHEAAFLLALMPFGAALAARPARPDSWLGGAFMLLSIIGLGVVRSRAGVILAGPALLGSAAIVWRAAEGQPRGRLAAAALAMTSLAAIGAVTLFALSPILARFSPTEAPEFRLEAWPVVAQAARTFLPLGAGLGAFDRVFRSVEPLALVGPTYFNHAHNDYLEIWLETGWLGVALLVAFGIWLVVAARAAWSRAGGALARAASLAILLVMAFSVADYPLRTTAVSTLFAYGCAVLTVRTHPRPGRLSAGPDGATSR